MISFICSLIAMIVTNYRQPPLGPSTIYSLHGCRYIPESRSEYGNFVPPGEPSTSMGHFFRRGHSADDKCESIDSDDSFMDLQPFEPTLRHAANTAKNREDVGQSMIAVPQHASSGNIEWHIVEFLKDFEELWRFCYRKNMPPIYVNGAPQIMGDAGWGCMIRSCQMLVAALLRSALYAASDCFPAASPAREIAILGFFVDEPDAPLSVHRIAARGLQHGIPIGQWMQPTPCALAVADCIAAEPQLALGCYIVRDQTLRLADFRSWLQASNVTTVPSSAASSTTDNGRWNKSVLVLIPVRLGLRTLSEVAEEELVSLFKLPYCAGVVGGRPRSSFYFIGVQAGNFIYLDPHEVKTAILSGELPLNWSRIANSLKQKKPLTMPMREVDPCMILALTFAAEDTFSHFLDTFELLNLLRIERQHPAPGTSAPFSLSRHSSHEDSTSTKSIDTEWDML